MPAYEFANSILLVRQTDGACPAAVEPPHE
jgi:hypothetical protein